MTVQSQTSLAGSYVSVVVLGWGGEVYIRGCLDALSDQTYPEYEVIVVDNASPDRIAEIVERDYPHVRLIRTEKNLGVAGGNNVGLRAARGDILILTNVDTEARPNWIERLVHAFEVDPTIGIAGSKLLYPDGTIQYAGGELDPVQATPVHVGRQAVDDPDDDAGVSDTGFATGASLAIRREVLEQIGYEDEAYFPIDYEDPDICYRARLAGWRVCYVPQAVSIHYESSTFKTLSPRRFIVHQAGRIRFVCKFWSDEQLRGPFLKKESESLRSLRLHPAIMSPVYLKTLLEVDDLVEWRERLGVSDPGTSHQTLTKVLNQLRETCLNRSHSPMPPLPIEMSDAISSVLQQWLTSDMVQISVDRPLLLEMLSSDLSSIQGQVNSHLPIAWPDWPSGIWPKVRAALQKLTRRLLCWYINPIIDQQNQIDAGVLQALNTMFLLHRERASEEEALRAEIESLKQELKALVESQHAGSS